jgi:hypothetical protein
MARYLVLSGYDNNMKAVGDRCTPTHQAYAIHHGYEHEVVREYLPTTHPSHQKIRLLRERIDQYDAIMWLDADTVVMGVQSIDQWDWREVTKSFDPSLMLHRVMDISVDWCAPLDDDTPQPPANAMPISTTYVSCSNFILWNTPNTKRFLDEWDRQSERYAVRDICCWEQDGLRAAMKASDWFNRLVFRHNRRTFNAVHHSCVNRSFPNSAPMPWQPGDLLMHLTNVDRLAILKTL